jgi:hypothetical protein
MRDEKVERRKNQREMMPLGELLKSLWDSTRKKDELKKVETKDFLFFYLFQAKDEESKGWNVMRNEVKRARWLIWPL